MISKGEENLLYILDKELPSHPIIHQYPIKINRHTLYIDYYIPLLKLAFEFDGAGHRSFVAFFHKTIEGFRRSKSNDRAKEVYCHNNGITLIRLSDDQELTVQAVRNAIFNHPVYEEEQVV